MEKYPKYSHEEESVDEEEDLGEESQSEEEEEELSDHDDDLILDSNKLPFQNTASVSSVVFRGRLELFYF